VLVLSMVDEPAVDGAILIEALTIDTADEAIILQITILVLLLLTKGRESIDDDTCDDLHDDDSGQEEVDIIENEAGDPQITLRGIILEET